MKKTVTIENKCGEEITVDVTTYHCYYYEIGTHHVVNGLLVKYSKEEVEQLIDELEKKNADRDDDDIIDEYLEDDNFIYWLEDNYENI